ncbi:MAG: multiheme c-type cytochrome, partial [bacterium]|nr:multiheme c-type cytochrome [bacterium]
MNKRGMHVLLTVVLAGVVVLATALALAQDQPAKPAEAKKPTYVGSKACKICHSGDKKGRMWDIWQESKHAKSLAALDSAKGENKDPKCLKCHTTGHGAGGYGAEGMEALAVAEGLGAVGCEACHGPGSAYKSLQVMKNRESAIAAGLVIPKEATCTGCHNEQSPTFKGFKFDEYWAKIAHHIPKPADTS